MADSLTSFNTRNPATSQREKAKKGQKKNNAGGFSFKVNDLDRVKRFLVLGSEDSFYQSGAELTKENAKTILKVAKTQHKELVDLVTQYSVEGRTPKQNNTLFALALLSSTGSAEEKTYALSKLNEVARTGTALFTFVKYVGQFRGWGRGLRRAVSAWYTEKNPDQLGYQVAKFQGREGWTHRDLLRKAHAKTEDAGVQSVLKWAVSGDVTVGKEFPVVLSQSIAVKGKTNAEVVRFLKNLGGDLAISWEMLPTEALAEPKVWQILLDENRVPLGALLRNLSRLSRLGVLKPLGKYEKLVTGLFTNQEKIHKSRLHPLTILNGKLAYEKGYNDRGVRWDVNQKVVAALDKAFRLAFKNVEPTGQRYLQALDVSGSMGVNIQNSDLTARDASAALALVTAGTEENTHTIAFTTGGGGTPFTGGLKQGYYSTAVTTLPITGSETLKETVRKVSGLPFGGTDCALPMLYAIEKNLEVDTFIVFTDSETWAGDIHPYEALNRYRAHSGIDAKLIVVAMVSNKFTLADPSDKFMLDVCGFDTATPQIIAEFSRGL